MKDIEKLMKQYGSLRAWAPALGISHETLRRRFKSRYPAVIEEMRGRVVGIVAMMAKAVSEVIRTGNQKRS